MTVLNKIRAIALAAAVTVTGRVRSSGAYLDAMLTARGITLGSDRVHSSAHKLDALLLDAGVTTPAPASIWDKLAALAAAGVAPVLSIIGRIFGAAAPYKVGSSSLVEDAIAANFAALGAELVTNGGFDAGLDSWSSVGSVAVVGSDAVLTDSSQLIQNVTPGSGTLLVEWTQTIQVGTRSRLRLRNFGNSADVGPFSYFSGSGTFRVLVSTSTGLTLGFYVEAGNTVALDDLSVREIDLTKCRAFADPNGTTPVFSVEQPIGLLLDTSQELVVGPEMFVAGPTLTLGNWVDNADGSYTHVPNGSNSDVRINFTAAELGCVFDIEFTVSGLSGSNLMYYGMRGPVVRGNGTHIERVVCTSAYFILRGTDTTTTATVSGISIKKVSGNHWYNQSATTNRPVLKRDENAKYNLYFDGLDDWLETGVINPAGATEATLVMVLTVPATNGATQVLFEYGPGSVVGSISATFGSTGYLQSVAYGTSFRTISFNATSLIGETVVLTVQANLVTGEQVIRINGVDGTRTTLTNGGTFSIQKAYIGRRGGSSLPANIHVYGHTLIFGPVSDTDLEELEAYHAAGAGIAL